ncbi:unnamed protein product [Blepharisma stoltei]|uniref:Transmembrane protein 230 n=1 Tax=Blepharisma stoltei TaxID=1481888 RepID=A0AAU9JQE1_9CILI|nr:unnamed protein product [Blepharisma stoltei]
MEDEEEPKKCEPEILIPPNLEIKSLKSEGENLNELNKENCHKFKNCPMWIILVTIFFTITAIVIVIVGFILASDKLSEALPCWIIASLMMIPLGYCYTLLIKAYYAKPEERKGILFEIPDI